MGYTVILATWNKGKVNEYRSLLQDVPVRLVTPAEKGIITNVTETGHTYEENARLKAVVLARESGLIALGDDSGLEVDTLHGEPGIMSARYAGENASDRDRVNYLLSRMKDIPWEKRTARFRCIIALATPQGDVAYCSGEVQGVIAFEPRGEQGFGYDPIFYFPELGKTMAELPPDVKNRISHRGRAAQKVYPALQKMPFAAFACRKDPQKDDR